MRTIARRLLVATSITAVTITGVAACGTQTLKSYAQGTWNCRYIDPYDDSAHAFSLDVSDGTWTTTAGSPDGPLEQGEGGTWTLGVDGATITKGEDDSYGGGKGAPEKITDGLFSLVWSDNALDLTIKGNQVSIDYTDEWLYETSCTKA